MTEKKKDKSFYDSLSGKDKIRYHKLCEMMRSRHRYIRIEHPGLPKKTYDGMLYETKAGSLLWVAHFYFVSTSLTLFAMLIVALKENPRNIITFIGLYSVLIFPWLCARRRFWIFSYCDGGYSMDDCRTLYMKIMDHGGFEWDKVKQPEDVKEAS